MTYIYIHIHTRVSLSSTVSSRRGKLGTAHRPSR